MVNDNGYVGSVARRVCDDTLLAAREGKDGNALPLAATSVTEWGSGMRRDDASDTEMGCE